MFGLFKKKRRLISDYCLAWLLDSWRYEKLQSALPDGFCTDKESLYYGEDNIVIFSTTRSGLNYTAQKWARPLINEAKLALEIFDMERQAYEEEEARIYKAKEDKLKKMLANRD